MRNSQLVLTSDATLTVGNTEMDVLQVHTQVWPKKVWAKYEGQSQHLHCSIIGCSLYLDQ
jgi:hypothetical protein